MNKQIQPTSRRSRRVNLNFRSALAAILLLSGAAMGVMALTTETSSLGQPNQLLVGASGSGLPISVGSYQFRAAAATNRMDSALAAAVSAASPRSVDTPATTAMSQQTSQAPASITASETGAWSLVPQTEPPVRYNSMMAYDSARQQVVLFGGCCGEGVWELHDTWIRDTQGWHQVIPASIPPSSPPGREASAMAYDAARDQVVLFGGYDYRTNSVFGDTWVWDGKTQTWTEMHPPSSPSARLFHMMTYDAERQEIVLFGGAGYTGNEDKETWVWDGATWTQRQPATVPSGRIAGTLSYDAARKNAVLFGGQSCEGSVIPIPIVGRYVPPTCQTVNDTWTWDGTTWTQHTALLPVLESIPPARVQAAMDYNAKLQATVLFGGSTKNSSVWLWDGNTWSERPSQPSPSSHGERRVNNTMVYDQQAQQMILFGGISRKIEFMDDTWTWNETGWTEVARTWPRGLVSAAFDAARNELVGLEIKGEFNESGNFYDDSLTHIVTWTWNGSTWTKRNPPTEPPPRYAAGITYDAARKEVVVFGGQFGTTCPDPDLPVSRCSLRSLNDTWTWDGTTWTEHNTPTAPPARFAAAMAYDPKTKEVILFGGTGNCQGAVCSNFDDTWAWNGVTWEQRQVPVSPSARQDVSMAYDASSGQLVLFGGLHTEPVQNSPAEPLGDTWTWDGSTWTQQQPADSPSARWANAIGYSTSAGKLVLFGGRPCEIKDSYTQTCNDTWAWESSSWRQLMAATATAEPTYVGQPAPRNRSAVAEGPDGKFVVFGGSASNGLNDMWTWGIPISLPSLTSVVSRKTHGSAGPFDISLPLTGSPGVECRSGGTNRDYTMIFKFANELTSVGGATASATQQGGGNQSVATTGSINPADRKEYIVNLSGVPNAQVVTVNLANVNDSAGNSSASVSASMGVLLGDVNQTGAVDGSDVSAVQATTRQRALDTNFKADVNTSGTVDGNDVSIVQGKTRTRLP